MEEAVTVRKLEDEITKLKKARISDKALSAKNPKNKLQEQERTFTSDFLRAREAVDTSTADLVRHVVACCDGAPIWKR